MTTPAAPRDILSVTRLTRATRALLEGHFGAVWVEGEISNLARPNSGHLYFTLKDPSSQVRCAMFKTRGNLLGFTPANGAQVLVSARVSLYEPRGDFQLIVEHMEAAGEGALRLRFEALKRGLAAAGLFDEAHKKPVPATPSVIGVITSPTGAAIRDILHVLGRRAPGIPVILYPTPVQGVAAVPGIVRALAVANRRDEVDVIILARGGGSLEDLWAFNEEAVVRAIHASRLPVVTGVGHEVDFTLADLVADLRAATPSAAAERCAPDTRHLLRQVTQFERRLRGRMGITLAQDRLQLLNLERRLVHPGRRIEQAQQRLDELERRLPRTARLALARARERLARLKAVVQAADPAPRLALAHQRLDALAHRLPQAWQRRRERDTRRLDALAQTLAAVNPLATLERGYAIVSDAQGRIVRDAASLAPGDAINARLARGTLTARVERSLPAPASGDAEAGSARES